MSWRASTEPCSDEGVDCHLCEEDTHEYPSKAVCFGVFRPLDSCDVIVEGVCADRLRHGWQLLARPRRLCLSARPLTLRFIPTIGTGKKANTALGKSTRAVVTGTAASGRDSESGRTCEEFSVRGRKRFPAAFYGEVWSASQECHQRTAAICAWTTALAVAVPRPAPLSP